MKPVEQILLHDTENGVYGDCFRACVASILGMPSEDVPHFCDNDNINWFADLEDFLLPLGLAPLLFETKLNHKDMHFNCCSSEMIASGTSPRFPDLLHSVVYKEGSMSHDPHPDKTGIIGKPKDVLVFVSTQPQREITRTDS